MTLRLANIAVARTGAISFPQRFGGSLNLHVHFHTLAVDGVFEKHGGGVRFHEAKPPEKAEVAVRRLGRANAFRCARTLPRRREVDLIVLTRSHMVTSRLPVWKFPMWSRASGHRLQREHRLLAWAPVRPWSQDTAWAP